MTKRLTVIVRRRQKTSGRSVGTAKVGHVIARAVCWPEGTVCAFRTHLKMCNIFIYSFVTYLVIYKFLWRTYSFVWPFIHLYNPYLFTYKLFKYKYIKQVFIHLSNCYLCICFTFITNIYIRVKYLSIYKKNVMYMRVKKVFILL